MLRWLTASDCILFQGVFHAYVETWGCIPTKHNIPIVYSIRKRKLELGHKVIDWLLFHSWVSGGGMFVKAGLFLRGWFGSFSERRVGREDLKLQTRELNTFAPNKWFATSICQIKMQFPAQCSVPSNNSIFRPNQQLFQPAGPQTAALDKARVDSTRKTKN